MVGLIQKKWFLMSVIFPVVMIYKMGLFLWWGYSIIFILLSIVQVLVSISIWTNKHIVEQSSGIIPIKKVFSIIFTAFVFISINLFACWLTNKTAQKENLDFNNWNLLVQFSYLLSNLLLIVNLFVALAFRKLPPIE